MVCDSIKALAQHHQEWAKEYQYDLKTNEFAHNKSLNQEKEMVKGWFKF